MQTLLSFDVNVNGRDFVVGDICGCYEQLLRLENQLHFDDRVDRLFLTGGFIGKVFQSKEVLYHLLKPNRYSVLGNQEDVTHAYWLGQWPIDDFKQRCGMWFLHLGESSQSDCIRYISSLPIVIEVATDEGLIGIVHSECSESNWNDVRSKMNQGSDLLIDQLLTSTHRYNHIITRPIKGLRRLFSGSTKVAEPLLVGNSQYIRTGGDNGPLTAVDLDTFETYVVY